MSDLLGGVRSLINEPGGALRADAAAVRWAKPEAAGRRAGPVGASWSPTPLPAALPADDVMLAQEHDAFSLVVDGTAGRFHSGISGAVPIYAEQGADNVHFCTRIEPLVRTRGRGSGPARVDWDAWAHILAAGGPLGGRTTFEGVQRLLPWSRVAVEPGRRPTATATAAGWPWLDVSSSAGAGIGAVQEALAETVAAVGSREGLTCLLSGGWDSRILTVLAARSDPAELTAWTTSSDTGTVMEELIAAKVAESLGIRHEIVPPRRDEFGADLDHFARAVEHQTSFHVWLVPLAKAVLGTSRSVLDGLGGGLFVGGAFPDEESDRPMLDKRFDRLAKYLPEADEILDPRAVAQLRDRTRASFETVAAPLVDHPFGSTFTAYLTRTLPGISLAPYGLMARAAPVATPFLNDAVVRAALAIPAEQHADGRLYPELLSAFDADLAELPTALDLTPRQRPHQRRVSSVEAAETFRALLTQGPVRRLLAPNLATADLDVWRKHLDRTRPQHLIRALATLSLWLQHYADVLEDSGVDALLERG